mmetsp:Transcript_21255/g.36490  ORF Transcript_21255/g.36490 Transcript_21255/m.36490 type:complete len:235 (-) Transcript_21255:393-1097(-)|eukprot:CAMPEP_0196664998 /NCGR_PEP_ID=MMETSP1086-20130531/59274_1 /TAXON_ID=77921 /ORGANISM="Cyanoptyche  gloeocystis , Strain SAG4.97" /LENGTH=234 /DNA_ID=CAMNT_0042001551 /DNA_START=117 /DNA_END=821 /DNA_ORIENTATION=+
MFELDALESAAPSHSHAAEQSTSDHPDEGDPFSHPVLQRFEAESRAFSRRTFRLLVLRHLARYPDQPISTGVLGRYEEAAQERTHVMRRMLVQELAGRLRSAAERKRKRVLSLVGWFLVQLSEAHCSQSHMMEIARHAGLTSEELHRCFETARAQDNCLYHLLQSWLPKCPSDPEPEPFLIDIAGRTLKISARSRLASTRSRQHSRPNTDGVVDGYSSHCAGDALTLAKTTKAL